VIAGNRAKTDQVDRIEVFSVVAQMGEDLYEWGKSYLSSNPAIIGVLLGFVLSQLATSIRDLRFANKKARSIRRIIELEIEHNLGLLTFLKGKVELAHKADQFTPQSILFPVWQRKGFESHLPAMPDALNENNIVEVFAFYRDLELLGDAYSRILALKTARASAIEAGNEASHGSRGSTSNMFKAGEKWSEAEKIHDEMLEQWESFEQLIRKVLESGNPLATLKS
jgi:hypothetical protein